MSNFGFTDLRLVNAYDVAFREAKSAVKAGYILENAREYDTVAAAIADCSLVVGTTALGPRTLEHSLRRLEMGARTLRRHIAEAPAALLFGSEKFGLSNEDMAHCHWLLRIPARPEHGSMNLGQAVAVCLYELIRNSAAARSTAEAKAAAQSADLERLTELLNNVLATSGYPLSKDSTLTKTRRLIRRLNLSAHDAEVWLGMLRQIRWKLDQSNPAR